MSAAAGPGDLLEEARTLAQRLPAHDRDRLLAAIAVSMAEHADFRIGLDAALAVEAPAWRAAALAALASAAADEDALAVLRAALRDAAAALGDSAAAPGDAESARLDRVVAVLAEGGELAVAARLADRLPAHEGVRDALVTALLQAGCADEAIAAAMAAPSPRQRDALLAAIADEAAERGDRAAALAAAERIADPLEREDARLDALVILAAAEPDDEARIALGAVRDPVSALCAMTRQLRRCFREDDAEGARAHATVVARLAETAVPGDARPQALATAARLQADADDVAGALATARLLPRGPARWHAVEYALWRLVPEGDPRPLRVREICGRARDDDEREIAAAVVARALVERGELERARRWLSPVRLPARRAPVLQGLGAALLDRDDVRAARGLLRRVPAEARDDMTFRDLAIAQLRAGDESGAAATVAGLGRGAEWAVGSLAELAAARGQASRLREWAHRHLAGPLRVQALRGAAAGLARPYDQDGPPVFR